MVEPVAVELALVERARREGWSRQELRVALTAALSLATAEEIGRLVEAAGSARGTGEVGPGGR